jgi:hypothetical protein
MTRELLEEAAQARDIAADLSGRAAIDLLNYALDLEADATSPESGTDGHKVRQHLRAAGGGRYLREDVPDREGPVPMRRTGCKSCNFTGWICDRHPKKAWGHYDWQEAGDRCPVCNTTGWPDMSGVIGELRIIAGTDKALKR